MAIALKEEKKDLGFSPSPFCLSKYAINKLDLPLSFFKIFVLFSIVPLTNPHYCSTITAFQTSTYLKGTTTIMAFATAVVLKKRLLRFSQKPRFLFA